MVGTRAPCTSTRTPGRTSMRRCTSTAVTRPIDEMPLESCMGEAHVVDLSGFPERGLIGVGDLGRVADAFVRGDSLLLFTGWSKHFEDRDYYRGNFPRVSEGLATWCAEQGVKMLGVEPPSVADVNDLPRGDAHP